VTLVPYRGSGPVAADVLAGHIPLGVVDIPSSLALIRAGRIRAIAVSAAHRVVSLPDVPTFAEAGLPGYESIGWFGIVAPIGTPPGIIARLNQAFLTALTEADIQDRIRAVGAEPAPGTPDQFARFIRAEIAKWAKVVIVTGAREN
jgi:tripartite-type tricarboxylate transporter receptor subunit TctC